MLQTTLIEQAHAAGLRVHTYTFRSEPATLAPEYRSDPKLEYRQFYALGIDGVFSDFPDVALKATATAVTARHSCWPLLDPAAHVIVRLDDLSLRARKALEVRLRRRRRHVLVPRPI